MRYAVFSLVLILCAASSTEAIDFLGVELCEGSTDTSVVLPVGSPLSLEGAEIGRHGGLLLLLTADNGDIMDHIDNLMVFYTDSRGTGDAKKLQWSGNQLTAYAQLIKKGYAALAISTTQPCGEATATAVDEEEAPVAESTETPEAPAPEDLTDLAAAGAAAAIPVVAGSVEKSAPPPASPPAVEHESAMPPVAAEPDPPPDFVLKGRLKHAAAEDEWVDVMGIVVNNSGAAYAVASFDLSFYDGLGELICVDTISVNQLRDGQERAFRSAIRCADYNDTMVASWKLQFAGAH